MFHNYISAVTLFYFLLGNLRQEPVPLPALTGSEYKANVVQVKDGDTVVLAINLFRFSDDDKLVWTTPVRLYGINTPEIHTTNAEEKAKGLASKAFLEGLVKDKEIILVVRQREKFGRLLGDLRISGEIVNKKMVDAGHAKVWDGLGVRPW